MTDKEFDNILKGALTSAEVPSELNRALLAKAQNKKKAKILTFIKSASAVAAVFVCAVAVLSYYNSDVPLRTEDISPAKETKAVTETAVEKAPADTDISTEEKAAAPEPVQQKEAALKQEAVKPESTEAADNSAADLASEEIFEEAAAPAEGGYTVEATLQDSAEPPQIFSRSRKALPSELSGLFNEDYDYKAVINEKISAQIAALPNSSEYTFSGISGEEAFLLNEDNLLTIIFASGIITPDEHGEQFFTVGTLADGKLR